MIAPIVSRLSFLGFIILFLRKIIAYESSTLLRFLLTVTFALGAMFWSGNASAEVVTGFQLIDADTDQVIGPVSDGDVVNISNLPTSNLNLEAVTNPAMVGSVVFAYNGNPSFRTENVAPYALFGDSGGNFNPGLGLGSQNVTATPFSGGGGSGMVGTSLTISFTVVEGGMAGDLTATPTNVDFGAVAMGNSGSQGIQLTNAGIAGNPDIVVSAAQMMGADATEFSHDFSGSVTLGPGQSITVTVGFNPTNPTGAKSASLEFTHDGNASPLAVTLTGNATAAGGSTVVYRVNSGGAVVSATPNWATDIQGNPSPFVNAAATGNRTSSSGAAIDLSDPSIPVGTPEAIFQSERWDPVASPEMQWDFPVTPGSYEVRLFFADIYSGTQSIGARVFDVSIEGALVLDDYDIFTDVGGFTGVVKSFVVASDGNLDIDFGHVIENPAIKGIEIIPGGGPGDLGASPGSLNFGTLLVGTNGVQSAQLINLGSTGDPDIEVQSTALSGVEAADFSDDFAGPVTLSPGQSMTVNVTFSPTIVGNKTANLDITHDGINSPISIALSGVALNSAPVGFGKSTLQGIGVNNPTSLQFGPDGRLYVAQQNGVINIFTVIRNGPDDYSVTATETITDIQSIPNHDDDGTFNASVSDRLVTGLYVTGTVGNPVIYVNSSDPRIGAGPSGQDLNLDTNSGILSRLTWNGSSWDKLDLVVGLPRSEENHHGNGIALDSVNNILYIAYGGHTNAGATSNNFAFLPEFALAAAILAVDLDAIGETTHLLETLDDEDRPGVNDLNDPFGGNNGKNQAKLVPGGPVQIHAPGFRNSYDVIITQTGNMYTIDNGPNAGWGDVPVNEGTVTCTNDINEPGLSRQDNMHFVTGPGYYGGHPNPTRGNMANTFNASNPQSPVSSSNPIECDYLIPGVEDDALETFGTSTNGLVEYTASNFGGAMLGDLLTASFSNQVFRLVLDPTGATVISKEALFSTVGSAPLDVTAQDDSGNLPGTIWVADVFGDSIVVFEPNDFDGGGGPICTGADDPQLDEDGDGYDNADEIVNGTDPCSSADVPPDADGDFTSDLNDPDDDNDTLPDTSDPFAIDANNGSTTNLPVLYTWENDAPNPGGLLNLGFTGLMTNNTSNYEALFDPTKMTAGGAAGVVTLDEISPGDAGHIAGDPDNQDNGFQFGVNVDQSSGVFTAHTRINGPFIGLTPEDFQSMGLFIGNGDQDNYVKIVLNANGGFGGVQLTKEENGSFSQLAQDDLILPGPDSVDLYLEVEPSTLTVEASYEETTGGVTGPRILLGSPESIPAAWLNGASKLAVGIISTSRGASSTFPGTWDFIEVQPQASTQPAEAFFKIDPGTNIDSSTFASSSFQITNNSLGGQKITSMTIDLSPSILPDMVFDPNGTAGDTTAKDFTPDTGASETGFVNHSFQSPHDGGFDSLDVTFNDFAPTEQFTFSVDVDPTSIQGVGAPGPNATGSVSGLELSGSTVTVNFDDGSQHVAELFASPGTVSDAENIIQGGLPAQPSIEVVGLTPPVTVANPNQTVRVFAPNGSQVTLLVVEAGLFTAGVPGGGFDLDPFEGNSALVVTEHSATVVSQGFVDIPVTLTQSDPDGGLNYMNAVIKDATGNSGPNSATTVVIEFSP